mgnify:CR=1 FL=1
MSNFNHTKMVLDFLNQGRHDLSLRYMNDNNERGIVDSQNQFFTAYANERETKEHSVGNANNNSSSNNSLCELQKAREGGDTTIEKLKSFFECVQRQHPESRLELQYVDGGWKVWCGVCKKLLRPDKSGKAIHNIQRQHFTSSRHKKKLHLMLQAEEEEAERRKNSANGRGYNMMQLSDMMR